MSPIAPSHVSDVDNLLKQEITVAELAIEEVAKQNARWRKMAESNARRLFLDWLREVVRAATMRATRLHAVMCKFGTMNRDQYDLMTDRCCHGHSMADLLILQHFLLVFDGYDVRPAELFASLEDSLRKWHAHLSDPELRGQTLTDLADATADRERGRQSAEELRRALSGILPPGSEVEIISADDFFRGLSEEAADEALGDLGVKSDDEEEKH